MVITMTAAGRSFSLDGYVVDVLLRDLVGHDRSPSAFLVFLFLWRRTHGDGAQSATMSHRQIAEESGLSKSAVQQALRILHRRGLVRSSQRHRTDTPEHRVVRTWAREKATGARADLH
jgi:DNA-binding MarR family transcriptional regulator